MSKDYDEGEMIEAAEAAVLAAVAEFILDPDEEIPELSQEAAERFEDAIRSAVEEVSSFLVAGVREQARARLLAALAAAG